MGVSPWRVGQLSPVWTINMVRDNNTIMDLTGVTTGQLSLIIYNASRVITGTGAGTFTITSAQPGIVTYQLVSGDVPTTAGQYWIRVGINFNSTAEDYSDYISWIIQS